MSVATIADPVDALAALVEREARVGYSDADPKAVRAELRAARRDLAAATKEAGLARRDLALVSDAGRDEAATAVRNAEEAEGRARRRVAALSRRVELAVRGATERRSEACRAWVVAVFSKAHKDPDPQVRAAALAEMHETRRHYEELLGHSASAAPRPI